MNTDNEAFILFLLIVVIVAIIQTAPDFQTGVMRVSLIVYGVILYKHSCKSRTQRVSKSPTHQKNTNVSESKNVSSTTSNIIVNADTDEDLDIKSELIEDYDENVDTSEDHNSRSEPEQVKYTLHEAIHRDYYPEDGHIYNTAKNRYTSCYAPPSYEINRCQMYDATTFDEENSRQARARDRSKRSIDGMVSKTADYYAVHFAREFDKEEAKNGWWGDYNYGNTSM